MKRKLCLGFLVLLMALLLTATLVACNQSNVSDFNKDVKVQGDNVKVNITSDNSYLKFSFPKGAPSIFHSLWIKDANYDEEDDYQFDIEDVEYAIVYEYNGTTTEIPMGNVTQDMVAEEDLKYLNVAGHKTIHLSTTYKGQTISGSFALHLKDHSAAVDLVLLTFDLAVLIKGESKPLDNKYAYATFGDTNDVTHTVYVNVEKGIEFSSWNEFISNFTFVYENYGDENNMALIGIEDKANSNNAYGVESSTTFKIDAETEFRTLWTRDIVTVKFELNNPNNAYTSTVDPITYFNGTNKQINYSKQVVAKNIGVLTRPDANYFNCYRGYYFAGWYTEKEGGTLWAFSSVVGDVDRVLYGHWRTRSYSTVIYSMGGDITDNITSSVIGGKTLTTDNVGSYKLVDADLKYNVSGTLSRITLTGLQYGVKYSNYAIKISQGDKTSVVLFKDLLDKFEKGGTFKASNNKTYDVLNAENLYNEYTCTTKFNLESTTQDDIETYVLWKLNDRDLLAKDFASEAEYKVAREKMLSLYYTRVLFKDSYTMKADGSIRLNLLKDDSLHELEIPANIWIGENKHELTEFAKNSVMNAKGLVLIDFSNASNLTTIGESTFAHDINLVDVKNANKTKVNTVGKNAFYDTKWEDEYANNTGKDVIVFNTTIYKYVGPTTVTNLEGGEDPLTTVDLTAEKYNDVFTNVTNISNSAFSSIKTLETIILPDTIESIEDYAFANIKSLKNVQVTADTSSVKRIKYVGSNAFDGCTTYLSSSSDQYNSTANAIILGDLYYKSLTTGTTATIPTGIRFIAPNAFEKSGDVATITFENESAIEYIGEDAFYATKWIATDKDHKFTIVNGMLTAFYSTSYEQADVNIVIPDTVKVINKHAFNSYSQYVKSIQFNAGLEEIEADAFVGAVSLKTFIFSKAEAGDGKISKAPVVTADAFADDGQLISGIKFYFRQACITELTTLLATPDADMDEVTKSWFVLFKLYHEKNFAVEEYKSIRVNSAVIPNIVLKTTGGLTNGINQWLNDVKGTTIIDNGLIIESNAGVKKYESLNFGASTGNYATIVEITSDGEYKAYYDKNLGFKQYVIKFVYSDSSYQNICQVKPGDPDLFIVTEYVMIKGATFYTSDTYTYNKTAYTTETTYKTIKGFEGDIVDSDPPIFFTTHGSLNLSLKYTDVDNVERTISGKYITIENFSIRNEVETTKAYININFYNLGTFKFEKQYKAQESKIKAITQTTSISIPLNASWKDYLSKHTLNLVGQDESLTPLAITSSNFDLSSVNIDTTELGMGTCFIQYTKTGTVNSEVLKIDAVYSIVLDADPTVFTYEVLNEKDKTARITNCSAKLAQTIIIPSTWTNDGQTYTVTEIGYNTTSGKGIVGVFENFTALETVYLAQTIKTIGVNTFKGCTLLKEVYTATASTTNITELNTTNFEVLTTSIEKSGIVNVTNYQFAKVPAQIVLPTTTIETVNEAGVETVYTLSLVYANDLFKDYTGIIYLTFNDANLEYAINYLYGNKVVFMTDKDIEGTSLYNFVKYDSKNTDLAAIVEENIATKNSTDLGAKYKFAYTLDSKDATASLHFVYDIATANIVKTTKYNDVKLKSIPTVTSGNTIAIGLNYQFKESATVDIIDRIVDIADSLVVENNITMIYIPDSIYTICTFKNKSSVVISPVVYASASGYMFDTIEKLPASLTTIKSGAFLDCDTLKSLDFSVATNLSLIEANAFENSGLTSVDLTNNTKITEINSGTFKGCYKLETVKLNSSIVLIGEAAFSGCKMLSSITGVANVKVYDTNAFNNCLSLTEFTLDSVVEKVGAGAFAGCKAITIKVYCTENKIPTTWNYQWKDEFNNVLVYDYKNNNSASDGKTYCVVDGIRYTITNDLKATVAVQAFNISSATIPTTINVNGTNYQVVTIAESAFAGNTNLTTINIASSVTEIQARAFYGCSGLMKVDGGSGLTKIAETAFTGCTALAVVPKVTV